jgi:hypothetical protein
MFYFFQNFQPIVWNPPELQSSITLQVHCCSLFYLEPTTERLAVGFGFVKVQRDSEEEEYKHERIFV